MLMLYADIWVYPDRIEVRQHERVLDRIPLQREHESWGDFVLMDVAPQVESRGWRHHQWHRPKNNSELLASTFAWRAA